MEGGTGVSFPDEALVAEVAAIEAARPAETVTFRWSVGVAWALLYSLAGGGLFAAVSYATNAQFGIVSIVIGLAAGAGAAKGGRSREAQIVGAVAAAIGYFAGQWMAVIAVVGWAKVSALPIDMVGRLTWMIVKETFSTTSALFLGIAVYEGWKIPRVRA